jgi:hypothetical protein
MSVLIGASRASSDGAAHQLNLRAWRCTCASTSRMQPEAWKKKTLEINNLVAMVARDASTIHLIPRNFLSVELLESYPRSMPIT